MRFGLQFLLLASSLLPVMAQFPGATPSESPKSQLLSPQQLDNLAAPVALYPDPLLGQVLAASTYPLEIVEAQQFLQRNGNLQGGQLMSAAKQQNWDASVQALVAFPDAVSLLTRDVQWTTALGNAFLAQQAGVIDAIQRLRARAQSSGRLTTTPQQVVSAQYEGGQPVIGIQPANPQVMYVPNYNPQYVWGPPQYGDYPQTGDQGNSGGFGFGDAVNIASYLAGFGGLLTGGWGWGLNWLAHSLFLNGAFFNLLGFHGGGGGGYGGYGFESAWMHNPAHRLGVPYGDRGVAGRFSGNFRATNAGYTSRGGFGAGLGSGWRTAGGGSQSFGARSFTSNFSQNPGGRSAGWHSTAGARPQFAPQQHFSMPKVSAQTISTSRSSGSHFSGASHFSSGSRFSGGSHVSSGSRSSGGHSSHGGGGHGGGGHGGGGHGHKR